MSNYLSMVTRAGKSYETWWAAIGERQSGPRYRTYVESFLSWMGWDYEELFTKYLEAKRSTDPRDAAAITGKVLGFYHKMRKDGYSPAYATNHVKGINSFFAENGVVLELTRAQRKEMPKRATREKDVFSKDEARAVIMATKHPRNRAIAYLMKDSGMACGDISDLNVGDVKRALDNGDAFTVVEYTRRKTAIRGSPCLGPESLSSLRDWMRWRVNAGISAAPDDPLFCGIRIPNIGKRLTPETVSDVIEYMVEMAFGKKPDKHLSAHCFRIFNASMLESAGTNRNIVYRLQARQIPDSGRVYSKGEVLSSYQRAYDSLAVDGTRVVEIQDSRVAALEQQQIEDRQVIAELVKTVKELKSQNQKV